MLSRKKLDRPAGPSPGSLLRDKRIEKGWSVPAVAEELRLSRIQVEALESDDYQHLPEETYILGYWRNYAGLLGISLGESVANHQPNLWNAAAGLPGSASASGSGTVSVRGSGWSRGGAEPSRALVVLAFALLSAAFLLGVWYWQQPVSLSAAEWGNWRGAYPQTDGGAGRVGQRARDGEIGTFDGSGEDYYSLVPEALIALPEPNFSEENTAWQRDTTETTETTITTETTETTEPTGITETTETTEPTEPTETTGTTGITGTAGQATASAPVPVATTADPVVDAVDAVVAQPAGALTQPQVTVSPNALVFAVARETWIEVHDSAGERLIYRSVAPDQRVVLEGRPPFSVFIGNAQGATVHYRGQPFPFTTGGDLYARFTVDAP